jgi:hypothetical protein
MESDIDRTPSENSPGIQGSTQGWKVTFRGNPFRKKPRYTTIQGSTQGRGSGRERKRIQNRHKWNNSCARRGTAGPVILTYDIGFRNRRFWSLKVFFMCLRCFYTFDLSQKNVFSHSYVKKL